MLVVNARLAILPTPNRTVHSPVANDAGADVVDVHGHKDVVNVDWILRCEGALSAHLITNRTTRKALVSQLAGCWFRLPGENISPKSTKPVPRLILRNGSSTLVDVVFGAGFWFCVQIHPSSRGLMAETLLKPAGHATAEIVLHRKAGHFGRSASNTAHSQANSPGRMTLSSRFAHADSEGG